MNPIKYLQNDGFGITSDPTWFKTYGYRGLFAYGANVDSYCGGYHRAYDLAKYHGAPIKAIANATVLSGTGWNTFGWTLVLGFKDAKGRAFQVIYGHLNQNPLNYLKVGQNVKQGQVVAYQGASNNLGVSMASHLHIQFQNYQGLNEWNFTCLGISPLSIDVSKSTPTSGSTPSTPSKPAASKGTGGWKKNKHGTWWKKKKGKFKNGNAEIQAWNYGPFLTPGNQAGKLPPGAVVHFDEIVLQDGHSWVVYTASNGSRIYLPIRTWNNVAPPNYKVGNAWGGLSWK